MALTYHPFAHVPGIDALGRTLATNVHGGERLVCLLSGAALVWQARRSAPLAKIGLYASAAGLIYRGLTGHCHLYEKMGIDTRN